MLCVVCITQLCSCECRHETYVTADLLRRRRLLTEAVKHRSHGAEQCEGRCSLSASWYNALKRFCYCITWTLHVVASIREPSAWLWWPGASQELCGNHGLRSRLVFLHRVSLAMTVSESTWLKQSWHLKVVSNVHSIISEAIVWIEESVGTSNRGST